MPVTCGPSVAELRAAGEIGGGMDLGALAGNRTAGRP